MNILVFLKRVASSQEEELKILGEGEAVDLSRLPFKLNDWDNYALEEAIRAVEKEGGHVIAISLGAKESDDVLRRAIAMGAGEGILILGEEALFDPRLRAIVASRFIKKEGFNFDAIFTGVQAEDDQFGTFGGYLAGILELPYVSMVVAIEEWGKGYVLVRRELEGGLMEKVKVSLPSVLSIQTGINEPRYVSVMGIRRASQIERKIYESSLYMEGVISSIEVLKWSYPPKKEGAKILPYDIDGACRELLQILKERGVCQ